MGKVKRLRQKLHIAAAKANNNKIHPELRPSTTTSQAPLSLPSDNLFASLNIDVGTLKTSLNDDDVHSVKSLKSEKQFKLQGISKKDKLKMRREMLLKKIDGIKQIKKQLKLKEKQKKSATIIGDINPLRDALPSLESLLKSKLNAQNNEGKPNKAKKGIEKAKKRKKELMEGMKIYKMVVKNKVFRKNPLEAITQHVQAVISQERQNIRK